MTNEIIFEKLNSTLLETQKGSFSKEILADEIEGLKTIYHCATLNETIQIENSKTKGHIFLFTSGEGIIDDTTTTHTINEISIFVPKQSSRISVSAKSSSLEFLELIIDFSEEDLQVLKKSENKLPTLIKFSNCPTYKEEIKSEKTLSRMILSENIFPRLCIGSVETSGNDHIASHNHPMLEQLFFGLKDNNCTVIANNKKLNFEESMLLHIPLGSDHSVNVEKPNKLNYIWIDLFKNLEDMSYITDEHIIDK